MTVVQDASNDQRGGGGGGGVPPTPLILRGLLEDPAIATWAREAASERRITPLAALWLLAQALLLDPQQ
jgi:hypothetical protein